MCGSRADAEDLVQEVCLRVLAKPRLVRGSDARLPPRRPAQHVHHATTRPAPAARRRRSSPSSLQPRARRPPLRPRARRAGAARSTARSPRCRAHYRDAVVAVDVLGLPYAEAAEALGVPGGTIMSRLYRGRSAVARRVGDARARRRLSGPPPRGITSPRCDDRRGAERPRRPPARAGRGGRGAPGARPRRPLRRRVSGEPGIGKTRLLEELARRGEERGCVVLTGRGAELEQDLPFGVWVDALDDHVAWLGPERIARMLGDRVAELARVLPSVSAGGRDARARAAGRALPRAPRRARAARAPGGARRPWSCCSTTCSGPTTRRSSSSPTCCAARRARRCSSPARTAPAGWPPPCSARSRRPPATAASSTWSSRRCRADEADALLGGELPARVRAELFGLSGGNPFYLQQLARGVAPDPATTVADARRPELPPAVAAALGQELARARPGRAAARAGRRRRGRSGRARPRRRRGRACDADAGAGALDELVGAAPAQPGRRCRAATASATRSCAAPPTSPAARAGGSARTAAPRTRSSAPAAPLAARAHHLERCAEPGDDAAIAVLAQAGHAAAPTAPAEAARWYAAALRLLPDGRPAPARGARAARHRAGLDRAAGAGAGDAARGAGAVPAELAELRARLVAACAACENLLGRHGAAHERLESALAELPERDRAPPAPMLEAELAADALYDSDFAALARPGGAGPRDARRRSATRRCACSPPRSTASPTTGSGDMAAAEAALDDAAADARRDGRRRSSPGGSRRPTTSRSPSCCASASTT